MSQKYTFPELCQAYQKTEIPIIQRDYAQGRNTADVRRIRSKFLEEFLIPSVISGTPVELDFVYGSVHIETKEEQKYKTFIPLDGQQRLTTLYLLYFIVALKESRLADIKDMLAKFTYETRPSAYDFCKSLLNIDKVEDVRNIEFEIKDAVWFNQEWLSDPTVDGMINVLNTFASNDLFINAASGLLDRLMDNENKLITFYFTDLEKFGLTESLYIRMNARGKTLTEFENFKSEFFKIIRYSHELLEDVKTKIEYQWVENLWPYKSADSYVVDDPFMRYLSYITEMLYYKDAPFRAAVSIYETDFLSFHVLNKIYSNKENLQFLIFSLDRIESLQKTYITALWEGEKLISINTVLADIINGSNDIDKSIVFFAALQYYKSGKPTVNMSDYLRVVRNLIVNTEDNSRREWPRLISSIQTLISEENVYVHLAELKEDGALIGFNVSQRKEEVFKARIIQKLPVAKDILFQLEDHSNFKGNITNILKTPFFQQESEFTSVDLLSLVYEQSHLEILIEVFNAYEEISEKNFNLIWGNLLITDLYKHTYDDRLVFSGYKKHPAILLFAKAYKVSGLPLADYLIQNQKNFIIKLQNKYADFSLIRNIKQQLYLYYIIHERVHRKQYHSFFKWHNFNFGWLAKESGFKSHFVAGIENSNAFENENPIFQLYNSQFRYNSGINQSNTLDIEIVGGEKTIDPFKSVIQWALNNK